jgi:ComF family protein
VLRSLFNLVNSAVNYALPYRCASCSELTDSSDGICPKCWSDLNFISKPFCNSCGIKFELSIYENAICGKCIVTKPEYELARSILKFDQYSKNLIHAFKYNDKTNHAKLFAKLIYTKYKEDFNDIDIIAPVPMNRFKRIYRYYNQSQLLAEEIARLMNYPVIPDLFIKTKITKPQTSLSKSQRQKNLQGSIVYNVKYNINRKKVLLVDDVHTTGSTISVCSKLLKQNGAASIKVSTIAMT